MEGGGSVENGKENETHPPPWSMSTTEQQPVPQSAPMREIVAVASIAAGVQFGWALRFSLLTPYAQFLGIPHKWASFIWLCGPISGMVIQPLAGHYSDQCTSRFGRRRPFIAAAAALFAVSVILISFAADIGRASGDPLGQGIKPRTVFIFVVGFWILDVATNLLMSPCRAFLSDLSGHSQRRMRNANAAFSFFTGVGRVLGYAAGSYSRLHHLFPFTLTTACDAYCANLKSCFFISITLLLTLTVMALFKVRETPIPQPNHPGVNRAKAVPPFFGELFGALKEFPKAMWILLLVTCLGSLAWYAFLLYDTDWMGREVYGGAVVGEEQYDAGVHAGSLGLMLSSAAAGVTSLAVVFLAREVWGGIWIWGGGNIFMAGCLAMTVWITKAAESMRQRGGGGSNAGVKAAAITLFAVMGIPQAIFLTIPFALAATYSTTAGVGQGLSMGVLNIFIVIPQLFVSLTSGPWDQLFGGGNLPSFVVGAIAAATSGIFALTLLPSPCPDDASVKIVAGTQ